MSEKHINQNRRVLFIKKTTQNPVSINVSCRLRLERELKKKVPGTVVADVLETTAVPEMSTVCNFYLSLFHVEACW